MNHTFSPSSPQVIIPITTPFNISFTLTPPSNFHPTPGVATRLLHVRTHEGKPKLTEIFELKISGNGQLVCELSGYGNRQPQFIQPAKFDLPPNGQYNVSYNNGILSINNSIPLSTHLAVTNGSTVELCFGFDKSGNELVAPLGWTLQTNLGGDVNNNLPPILNTPPLTNPIPSTAPIPITTVPNTTIPIAPLPSPPMTPPFIPPPFNPNIPIPIVPNVSNTSHQPSNPNPSLNPTPISSDENQLKKELIQDLTNLATKYALRQVDPQVILLIQLALSFVNR